MRAIPPLAHVPTGHTLIEDVVIFPQITSELRPFSLLRLEIPFSPYETVPFRNSYDTRRVPFFSFPGR